MAKIRLTWGGNQRAQAEADIAFLRLKDAAKSKASTNGTRSKKHRRKQARPATFRTYHEYISSPAWSRKRLKALRFHGAACDICKSTTDLDVHHKTYRRLGREMMEDLQILCRGCHANHHEGTVAGCVDSMTASYLAMFRDQ